ncbi:hypothetical protein JVT61DRAFT_1990 [Boletus reticuloceps]|uniref:Integrase core domain-containing protein n=1 Tax=Boletus reticuloceps TaxID=495285 RepID=A0A8I3AAU4_9AGAM|nr:hypothetical protein JVT61DRAFT_1990 [Boletus reticuloceps]
MLNATDLSHQWLLHYLFLEDINNDCQQFQNDWNHHPISARGHNQTPLDMQFFSALCHGTYVECHESHATTAFVLDDNVAVDQSRHIKHPAINVPASSTPFHFHDTLAIFTQALQEIRNEGIIPVGYGVAEEEWPDGTYPEVEVISVGRSREQYQVELPFAVWWPHAVLWAKGLDVMTRVCMIEDGGL